MGLQVLWDLAAAPQEAPGAFPTKGSSWNLLRYPRRELCPPTSLHKLNLSLCNLNVEMRLVHLSLLAWGFPVGAQGGAGSRCRTVTLFLPGGSLDTLFLELSVSHPGGGSGLSTPGWGWVWDPRLPQFLLGILVSILIPVCQSCWDLSLL